MSKTCQMVEFKRYLSLQFPFVTVVGLGVKLIRQSLKTQARLGLQPGTSPEETPGYCECIITNGVLTEKNWNVHAKMSFAWQWSTVLAAGSHCLSAELSEFVGV